MSENGIETDPDKISFVKSWPNPESVPAVRRFLGFVGYYMRLLSGFASIAKSKPLNDLLKGEKPRKSSKRSTVKTSAGIFLCLVSVKQHLTKLIDMCCNSPVLAYADFSKPFVLHIDGSINGLRAVLYQKKDGLDRVIAYAGRSLSKSEKNYSQARMFNFEIAVTSKFHDYQLGSHFKI